LNSSSEEFVALEWLAGLRALPGALRSIRNLERWQASLADREKALQLTEENQRLRTEVAELQAQAQLRSEVTFERNAIWLKADNSGPFCSRCFEADKTLVHLHGDDYDPNFFDCPKCRIPTRTGPSRPLRR
jgi:hypothetical protein